MIGYITTDYPAVSHTFILREVEALRRRGMEISTTSVHRASPAAVLSDADRLAFETTHALLPARWGRVARAHAVAVLRHPRAFLSTLGLSLRMRRPGARGLVRQLFYFGEAVTAWDHWRRQGVRHVHAHFVAVPADVALLASHLGRLAGTGPTTWSFTIHGLIELWDVHSFRLAEKVRRADAVICVSDFTRSQLMALVEERHWPKLHVVRCGVRPAGYASVGDPPPGRPRILCVGRLGPEKGQSLLVRAFATLAEREVDAELELVGDGPNRGSLERLADELGVADRVRFAGAVGQEAILNHYEAATVFCLSSFWEGIPIVLMEAMACGRPVVATAIAGVPELIRNEDSGLLVSPGRHDLLADALHRLLVDPELRRRLAAAAQRTVARCYDADKSAAELSSVFHSLLRGGPEPDAPIGAPRRPSSAPALASTNR